MKNLTILLVLLFFFGGCGGDDPAPASTEAESTSTTTCSTDSNMVGTWDNNTANEALTITSNCTLTSDYCGSSVNFNQTTSDLDQAVTVTLNVQSTNGSAGCLTVGSHTCIYTRSMSNANELMAFACTGFTTNNYVKR